MKKIIDVNAHALFRTLERGFKHGLNYYETKNRIFETVRKGILSKHKHISKHGKTYYNYYNDNLSFYVTCKERMINNNFHCLITTVIIEKGRE